MEKEANCAQGYFTASAASIADVTSAASGFVRGLKAGKVEGRVLRGDAMNAHNTFAQPDAVSPAPFTAATLTPDGLNLTMPRMSVVALDVM